MVMMPAVPPYFVDHDGDLNVLAFETRAGLETSLVGPEEVRALREFQSEHIQVAVVFDEYGARPASSPIERRRRKRSSARSPTSTRKRSGPRRHGRGEYLVSGLLRVTRSRALDPIWKADDYGDHRRADLTSTGRIPKTGTGVKKNGYQFHRRPRRPAAHLSSSRSKDPDWTREDEEERESRG